MIFLDVNVLLEILFRREKYEQVCDLLAQDREFGISFLSVHLFYHFGLKNGHSLEKLADSLKSFQILNCGQEVYDLAKKVCKNNDFEDSLQVATAMYHQVDSFCTLDQNLAKNYRNLLSIKVI
jgi:predicted nucleic acid-binding protein